MRCWSLNMKTCVLLLATSCAETVQMPTPSTPSPTTVSPLAPSTATEVLRAMANRYASAKTYADRGTITTVFSGNTSNTTTLSFETAFRRNQRFRFEYRSNHEFHGRSSGAQRYVIWSDFTHSYSEWTVEPGIVDDGSDLWFPLGAAAGVSGGSSITIASMLMPDVVGGGGPIRLRTPTIDGTEPIDGHPCWRIKGNDRNGDAITLWVDRDTYMIRRLVTGRHFAAGDAQETMAYEPTLDQPVEEAHLAQPDIVANPPVARKPSPPGPQIGIMLEKNTPKIRLVLPGGPADRAGLQAGDTIVAVGGQPVISASEVRGNVWGAGVGARVDVEVTRGGSKLVVPVTTEATNRVPDVARDKLLDKPAPAFDLPVVTGGGSARLAGLAGSVVIVAFGSTSCGRCTAQVPHLNELARKYSALRVIGVSSDSADEIRQYALDNHVAYTLASDADEKALTAYWGIAYPMLVVIDKAGVVRGVQLGASDASQLDSVLAKLLP